MTHDNSAILPEVICGQVIRELDSYLGTYTPDLLRKECEAAILERSRNLYAHNKAWKKVMDKGMLGQAYVYIRHWSCAFLFGKIPGLKRQWQLDPNLQQFALGHPLNKKG